MEKTLLLVLVVYTCTGFGAQAQVNTTNTREVTLTICMEDGGKLMYEQTCYSKCVVTSDANTLKVSENIQQYETSNTECIPYTQLQIQFDNQEGKTAYHMCLGSVSRLHLTRVRQVDMFVHTGKRTDVTGEVVIQADNGFEVNCNNEDISKPEFCPCYSGNSTIGPGRGPGASGGSPSLKKRLTAGFVSAFVFIIILGVIGGVYYYMKQKRMKQEKEDSQMPPPGAIPTASVNTGYAESKSSLGSLDAPRQTQISLDPSLNLEMRTSRDSGLADLNRQSGPNSSQDDISPYSTSYAVRGGGPPPTPPPQLAQEEIEALYAQPHKRRDSPPIQRPPRSRSREQLDSNVNAMLDISSNSVSFSAGATAVETDI